MYIYFAMAAQKWAVDQLYDNPDHKTKMIQNAAIAAVALRCPIIIVSIDGDTRFEVELLGAIVQMRAKYELIRISTPNPQFDFSSIEARRHTDMCIIMLCALWPTGGLENKAITELKPDVVVSMYDKYFIGGLKYLTALSKMHHIVVKQLTFDFQDDITTMRAKWCSLAIDLVAHTKSFKAVIGLEAQMIAHKIDLQFFIDEKNRAAVLDILHREYDHKIKHYEVIWTISVTDHIKQILYSTLEKHKANKK